MTTRERYFSPDQRKIYLLCLLACAGILSQNQWVANVFFGLAFMLGLIFKKAAEDREKLEKERIRSSVWERRLNRLK